MITSLAADCGTKRKRDAVHNALDGAECNKDETALVETSIAADRVIPSSSSSSSSSSIKPICFLEFRLSTIHQYPSLTWLGPAVMAVYWFKEYLNKPSFGWVRLPKENQRSLTSSSSSSSPLLHSRDQNDEDRRRRQAQARHIQKRRRKNNSKGNFYFIPGQYLRSCSTSSVGDEPKPEKNIVITQEKVIAVQTVLDIGTPGIHYATSYIGVYNLLRSYGRFVKLLDDHENRDFHKTSIYGSMGLDKSLSGLGAATTSTTSTTATTRKIVPNAFPVGYDGPPLPQ